MVVFLALDWIFGRTGWPMKTVLLSAILGVPIAQWIGESGSWTYAHKWTLAALGYPVFVILRRAYWALRKRMVWRMIASNAPDVNRHVESVEAWWGLY